MNAVARHGVSIALACRTLEISETCYRYSPVLSDENEENADWLERLTANKRSWGFGLTQDDATTDAAKLKRKNMGLYVATLLRLHVDQNLAGNRKPASRLCVAIDVQHGEAFVAPKAMAQRTKDITGACQMISALWPTL